MNEVFKRRADPEDLTLHQRARVVEDCGEYAVVEKVGEAARVAKRLDPRAGG